jgi:hypothetical protein
MPYRLFSAGRWKRRLRRLAARAQHTSDLVAKEEVSGSHVLTINGYSLTKKSRHIHHRYYYRKHFEVRLKLCL